MKRWISLLLAAVLLGGCASTPQPTPEPPPPVVEQEPEYEAEQPPDPIYIPPKELSIEETIDAYFAQQYLSYTHLTDVDITAILDTTVFSVRNIVTWNRILTQRRRLIEEENLCFVQTEAQPYTLRYIEDDELLDDRLANWDTRWVDSEGVVMHFVITGEPGKAYPPIMAVNAQHTIRLKKLDGVWKITFHYFPGSIRKFLRGGELMLPSEEEMRADLLEEFAYTDSVDSPIVPASTTPYIGEAAADYARRHTETPNPDFYLIDDWMGNCANFISQCVWYGFGAGELDGTLEAPMTNSWYAGGGGGSPAWENVESFWELATEGVELSGQQLDGIDEVVAGDVIQTSSGAKEDSDEDDYNHSLVVVDSGTLLLAQNSPACFIYYSDVVNVETRLLRPVYLP